ncbi:MAG: hypothetical protein OHK0029_17590 [Armatimonadaceae bacterium]
MDKQRHGMHVKIFNTVPTELEVEMNQWLSDNPEVVVRDIRVLQVDNNGLSPTILCMLFYGGKEDLTARRAGFRSTML